jgi:hypothetical protein
MGRKVEICTDCGETREIAAQGLCFKCYRRQERVDPWARPDQHSKQLRKAQRRTRKAIHTILNALDDLDDETLFPEEDATSIRRIIAPHWSAVGRALAPAQDPPKVNSEHAEQKEFTPPTSVSEPVNAAPEAVHKKTKRKIKLGGTVQ